MIEYLPNFALIRKRYLSHICQCSVQRTMALFSNFSLKIAFDQSKGFCWLNPQPQHLVQIREIIRGTLASYVTKSSHLLSADMMQGCKLIRCIQEVAVEGEKRKLDNEMSSKLVFPCNVEVSGSWTEDWKRQPCKVLSSIRNGCIRTVFKIE